jgi:hypothetical protein
VTPGPDYPKKAPAVRFISKVNLPGVVDARGNVSGFNSLAVHGAMRLWSPQVDSSKVSSLKNWASLGGEKLMSTVLREIQRIAVGAPSSQPSEDATY